MEFETKLESIDKKISDYSKKVDDLSNVIIALTHSLGQESSLVKEDIVNELENKINALEIIPDAKEAKEIFQKISNEIKGFANAAVFPFGKIILTIAQNKTVKHILITQENILDHRICRKNH